MEVEFDTQEVRTLDSLYELLEQIESGSEDKPDWIDMQGKARLFDLSEPELSLAIKRLHGCVLRGFHTPTVPTRNKRKFLDYWIAITRNGFHDFAEDGWRKCFDSPFVEDYDYVTDYIDRGLEGIDPYKVYAAVLGTFAFAADDFVNTELCKNVKTIIEPLAGSSEFAYTGHFHYPDFKYFMFDIDEEAKAFVEGKPWLEGTEREYHIGNALEEETWQAANDFSEGESLCYLGKQSQNFFGAKDLLKILDWGTTYTDYFMLELTAPYILDEGHGKDDLTRPESRAAGFRVALEDVEDNPPNPITNSMEFALVAWDSRNKREFFRYDWNGWQAPTLVSLAELVDAECFYFHGDQTEFLPVEEFEEDSDFLNENTFIVFTKRDR